ncbi:DUF2332 domain-containing protein [Pseudonocardia sp. RS11V-5]|uniref:DUF2332 domain-containing protein n=1 Tax=Pseudonocardia terrae TaxID=2905831 RepID=UPI001E389C99|nr:DUF2332 domain-containing protein [Pseudonocardia terrae]MCE3552604.1 DUF2332 domain-containing protein [Pseudonocardia terrae]
MTDRTAQVAAQARAVADAWSAPGAPPSWWLTAALLRGIADDEVLLGIAAGLPLDHQPALLLSAAVRRLAAERGGALADYFPVPGKAQPEQDDGFAPALAAFARAEREGLARLCAGHRYQMTEVARSLDVLPVLAAIAAEDPRPLALVDLGTGAGLGLRPDRYAYRYRLPDGTELRCGSGPLELSCEVRGATPPVPPQPPVITARVGVDVEPHDLADPATRAWLAACVPPEAGAVSRFATATELALADPAPIVRGDVVDALVEVVAGLPPDALVCLVDTYVHVFLGPERLAAFDDALVRAGRDLEWISVDPLVPLGPEARATVQGLDVSEHWIAENREGGVFGVIGRVSVRDGARHGTVLGRAHPSAAWLEWLG